MSKVFHRRTTKMPVGIQSLLNEKDARIQQLEGQIEKLTSIVAMSQKNIGALTEQLDDSRQMIEAMRQRRTIWQRLKAVFVVKSA